MTSRNRWNLPDLGLGIGLRTVHFPHILQNWPKIDWFEILSENFMGTGGRPMWILDQVAAHYPLAMHGVSMNIGTTDPIDWRYFEELKVLAERCKAAWVGDHVCWTGVGGRNSHDLLPLPYNEPTLVHLVDRIRRIQDFLERPLVLENPSTYLQFTSSDMPEPVFLRRMAEESDCALLLDVNNIYVTASNHRLDPQDWLDEIPWDRVVQVHLSGHTDKGTHIIDTHIGVVIDPVWEIYAEVMKRTGGVATLLEWDEDVPEFDRVHAEVLKAAEYRKTLASGARAPAES